MNTVIFLRRDGPMNTVIVKQKITAASQLKMCNIAHIILVEDRNTTPHLNTKTISPERPSKTYQLTSASADTAENIPPKLQRRKPINEIRPGFFPTQQSWRQLVFANVFTFRFVSLTDSSYYWTNRPNKQTESTARCHTVFDLQTRLGHRS